MSMTNLARAALLFICVVLPISAQAEALEKRIALVIGNGAYQISPLTTPANDAGLVAQTLQAAGFDVVGARDLDIRRCDRRSESFSTKPEHLAPTPWPSSISPDTRCSLMAKTIWSCRCSTDERYRRSHRGVSTERSNPSACRPAAQSEDCHPRCGSHERLREGCDAPCRWSGAGPTG